MEGYNGAPKYCERSKASSRVSDADKDLTWFIAAWMIVMKVVVLFGSERLIRSNGTVLVEKLTRCMVNAQPMLLQFDQTSMSVSVCVQT